MLAPHRQHLRVRVELTVQQLGPLPVLVAGDGPPLLYLGGLLPVAGIDASVARQAAGFSMRPVVEARRVFYANRRKGLPTGMTVGDLAAEHAAAVDVLGAGPVDVIGASTGGTVAQQLALDYPRTVRRLVLIGAGCRLSPRARKMQARVAADIRGGRPDRALAAFAIGVLAPQAQPLARLLGPLMRRPARRLGDLSDLAVTLEAEDSFDLARATVQIAAPTLIVAGARDRINPRPLLEEAQRLIPGSALHLIPRRGHITAATSKRAMQLTREFLDVAPAV